MTIERIGTITLVHGDCMDYMRTQPDGAYDLAVVDPPYGDARGKEGAKLHLSGGKWAAKYARPDSWDTAPGPDYFAELARVARNRIIWGGNYFGLPPTRCFLVWHKTSIPESFTMAMCEYAWTSFDGNAKLFRWVANGTSKAPRWHPTQKPVELYSWILRNYAQPGDKILDTHGGSMTHAIAAHDLGLDLTIIERDDEYYQTARSRLLEHQAKPRLL